MGDQQKVKTRCVIVAGGDCDVHHFDKVDDTCFVIAADSGLSHCINANITPDLIVGDFDSYNGDIPNGVEVQKLPTHKDDTDLLYAARSAIKAGFSDITVLGGYGSRPDQNMAMYQTLCWIVDNCEADKATAICNGFELYVIKNSSLTFMPQKNRYLSVFAIDGDAKGIDIIGAEYPLNNATITASFPVGVSNVVENKTTVSVKIGKLLIMLVDKSI